jgi:HAD superfamily phosphoserine phosphatase-like hydrolase
MSNYIFLFDLDSTLTKKEILPEISKAIGKEQEMRRLTEETMQGVVPFKQSFLSRVDILKDISIEQVQKVVEAIPLNEHLIRFIQANKERCYIVTGNLDIWIKTLMKKLGLNGHYYCSKAIVDTNGSVKVISVLDKELTVKQFVQPMVAIGDGNNDSDMARYAEIAIGYGGVRDIAPALLKCIDYGFMSEKRLTQFLETLL